jgi:flagellar hook protein FlgE
VFTKPITVFDTSANPRVFNITFTNTATDNWDYSITESGVKNATAVGTGKVKFAAGSYTDFDFTFTGGAPLIAIDLSAGTTTGTSTFTSNPPYTPDKSEKLKFTPSAGAADVTLKLNMSDLTQFGSATTVKILDQDGYASGQLDAKVIDVNGVITGRYSNNQSRVLGQVAIANFNNPGGLTKTGDSLFTQSANSGEAQIGASGTGGRGSLNPGSLEMSNVDLAQEFSNMIITQRGFQANSKIISTTDEMLQELANLKR